MRAKSGTIVGVAAALLLVTGCGSGDGAPELPTASELEGLYGSRASVQLNGNVVDVRAEQSSDQLQRGGVLWAKVGPYIFLFSPQTRELFEEHPDVAAVRVRTLDSAGNRIAEATLRRDALNELTWNEAGRRVTRARTEGTEKPGLIEDLVQYGEELTTYSYNPAYTEG